MEGQSEEEHLRAIWNDLGVGRSGFLTLPELCRVCEHIGMADLSDEDLLQLFESLDVDGDGHVSFREFMRGLFRHIPATSTASVAEGVGTTAAVVHNSGDAPRRPLPRSTIAARRSKDGSLPTPSHTCNIFTQVGFPFNLEFKKEGAHFPIGYLTFQIDSKSSGFANGQDVIRFWETLGVLNGADVLRHLQFDPNIAWVYQN